jgi:hypothetical protein
LGCKGGTLERRDKPTRIGAGELILIPPEAGLPKLLQFLNAFRKPVMMGFDFLIGEESSMGFSD